MAQIITIAHQKGGVGKSTLSLNLAYVFKNGLQVGICDTDIQGSLTNLQLTEEGIDILTLPKNLNDLKNLPHEIIIIDTPPYLINRLPDLFAISDFVLIPTKAGILDFMAIQATIALLNESIKSKPALKAGIVFNMIKRNTNLQYEVAKLLKDSTIELMQTLITDRVSYTRSVVTGGVLKSNDAMAKKEMLELADEILNRMGL